MIIAIDGTSSSGKSSLARALGKKLNIPVVGTGSIYRAIASKLINFGVKENDDERIKFILDSTIIETKFDGQNTNIYLDGIKQKTQDLTSHEVSVFTPKIASKAFVREFVRKIQRTEAEKNTEIIVEGRDIGSVVFPNAEVKLYVDADLTARAKRRLSDYANQGKIFTLKEVTEEIQERDTEDRHRDISPLIMTRDSLLIDTTETTTDECVEIAMKLINEVKNK